MAKIINIVSPESFLIYDGKLKNYIKSADGDLTQLTTEAKDNLVNAINEIDDEANKVASSLAKAQEAFEDLTAESDKRIRPERYLLKNHKSI